MGELIISEAKRDCFIICPVSDDGIACSIVLNRRLKNVLNSFFVSETDPSLFLDYPAVSEKYRSVDLHIAGFPYNEKLAKRLVANAPARTFWYSHHYWPKTGAESLESSGVHLILDPSYSVTSLLIAQRERSRDAVAGESAAFLAAGKLPENPFWRNWFFLSLAVRGDPSGMRRALMPLYENSSETQEPDPQLVSQGEELYRSLKEHILSGGIYVFPIQGSRACALGVPKSMASYFRVYCQLAFTELQCSLAILFFDGEDQVAVIRDDEAGKGIPSEILMQALSTSVKPASVFLFDKNVFICPANGRIVETVGRIAETVKSIEIR